MFQLLNLLEVIIEHAEAKSSLSNASGASATEPSPAPHTTTSDAVVNTGSGGISSGSDVTSANVDDSSKPSTSGANMECDTETVLINLPQAELRLLCSLLAREGYVSVHSYLQSARFDNLL